MKKKMSITLDETMVKFIDRMVEASKLEEGRFDDLNLNNRSKVIESMLFDVIKVATEIHTNVGLKGSTEQIILRKYQKHINS
jgi:metal-responsive CopG/Arc/MetJ family transcriptional regulator